MKNLTLAIVLIALFLLSFTVKSQTHLPLRFESFSVANYKYNVITESWKRVNSVQETSYLKISKISSTEFNICIIMGEQETNIKLKKSDPDLGTDYCSLNEVVHVMIEEASIVIIDMGKGKMMVYVGEDLDAPRKTTSNIERLNPIISVPKWQIK